MCVLALFSRTCQQLIFVPLPDAIKEPVQVDIGSCVEVFEDSEVRSDSTFKDSMYILGMAILIIVPKSEKEV